MITTFMIWHYASKFDFGIKKNLSIAIENKELDGKPSHYRLANGALLEGYDKFATASDEYSLEEAQEQMKHFGRVFIFDGEHEVRIFQDFESFLETIGLR